MPCKEAHVWELHENFELTELPASRSLISIKHLSWGFTLDLPLNFGRAYIQPKLSIPIGGKVEISSKCFIL
jgi:hypothetical protein